MQCRLGEFLTGCNLMRFPRMTNNTTKNASEETSRKPSEISETVCQPKPPKRARTQSKDVTEGSLPDCEAMATGLASLRDFGDGTRAAASVAGDWQVRQSSPGPVGETTPRTSGEVEALECSHTLTDDNDDDDDDGERGCNSVHEIAGQTKNSSSCSFRQEWIWNESEMSEACVHVQGHKGAQVCFHQDYSCGTAAARGLQPMSEGQHFWEIKMDSPVYGTAMMIGIGTKQVDLSKYAHTFCNMLGNDTNSESCGLSYTGRFYQAGANGRSYCSKFGQGTVIGVHLDMWFGTLTFYKNSKCLGIATKGLLGKVWYPMISSTAARSSMCLQTARSFPSSLQFWCCRTLRRAIPAELNVIEVLNLPPGMRAFLEDNLMWLLDSHTTGEVDVLSKGIQTDLSMSTHELWSAMAQRFCTSDLCSDD